jgi:tRNA1Val (adenine37-N6)-methyltransferase
MPVLCEYPGEQVNLQAHETLDDLMRNGMKVIQDRQGYRFSMDSVLLSHFAEARAGETVLDLGCGSGVISFLVAARQPSCRVTGLEIQESLADRARRSVGLNKMAGRIEIINGDLRQAEVFLDHRRFSLIIANPPFWRQGEGKPSENREKLIARHEVNATLEDFMDAARRWLAPQGRLVMIHRASRVMEIGLLCAARGIDIKRMRFVYPYDHRDANLVLLEAVKGSRSGVQVLPPLVVYEDDGSYTEEINRIYFAE